MTNERRNKRAHDHPHELVVMRATDPTRIEEQYSSEILAVRAFARRIGEDLLQLPERDVEPGRLYQVCNAAGDAILQWRVPQNSIECVTAGPNEEISVIAEYSAEIQAVNAFVDWVAGDLTQIEKATPGKMYGVRSANGTPLLEWRVPGHDTVEES